MDAGLFPTVRNPFNMHGSGIGGTGNHKDSVAALTRNRGRQADSADFSCKSVTSACIRRVSVHRYLVAGHLR